MTAKTFCLRQSFKTAETTRVLKRKKKRISDWFLKAFVYVCAGSSIALFLGIMGYVLIRGIPRIDWTFLTGVRSNLKEIYSISGNIINTIYMICMTLFIATPFGIGAAIYLNEYAKPGKIVRIIEFTTETLSGIPSIIFGLFGMVFFGEVCGFGYSLLTGSLTLSLMILPLITRNTQEALRTVPDSYRNGAIGIGATKWFMIRTILLPSAMPGILTGVILSIGRIVGESAALLFTAGSAYQLPKIGEYGLGLLTKIRESGGTMTIELYLRMSNAQYEDAFGIAAVLMILVLAINFLAKVVSKGLQASRKMV